MKTKILIIAPYSGLKDVAAEAVKARDDIEADIYEGDLEAGIDVLLASDIDKYDVILSRGGTAMMLKNHTGKQVIDIGVTAYDLIRLMKTLDGFQGKIAIVAFDNIIAQAKMIGDLLNQKLDVYTITNNDEAELYVQKLKNENYDLILGDVITVQKAWRYGMNATLIFSGQESLCQALDTAVENHKARTAARDILEINMAILKNMGQYIYVCDSSGQVYENNIPDKSLIDILEKNIAKFENQEINTPESIETIDNILWHIRYTYIKTNNRVKKYACIVNRKENIFHEGSSGIDFYHSVLGPYSPYNILYMNDNSMKEVREQIDTYAMVNLPLLIVGEAGSGKKSIAYEIYKRSSKKEHPFIEIDCFEVDDDRLKFFLNADKNVGEIFSLNNATILFTNLECLKPELQKIVCRFVKTANKSNKYRIICSAKPEIADMAETGQFSGTLLSTVNELSICVPPLRERRDAIKSIVSILMYELNVSYGCSAVGIKPAALDLIQNFEWKENINQLLRVIRKTALNSKKAYISTEEIKDALNQERFSCEMDEKDGLSVEGTLDDIIKRVIDKVLREEDMNQSKAAARLGISRSTLWRKLQEIYP